MDILPPKNYPLYGTQFVSITYWISFTEHCPASGDDTQTFPHLQRDWLASETSHIGLWYTHHAYHRRGGHELHKRREKRLFTQITIMFLQ